MSETNGKKDEDFSLYTEKIVVQPSVKYRSLINLAKILGGACIFGIVASIVIAVVHPWMSEHFGMGRAERESLAIMKDEYPTEEIKNTESELDTIEGSVEAERESLYLTSEDYGAYIKSLETNVAMIKRSMVTVDSSHSSVDDFISGETSDTETVGIVIGQINSEYIVMTYSEVITDEDSIVVRVSDSTEINATLLGRNDKTGIALIGVREGSIPAGERSMMVVANLGNSYNVKQGDMVIAAGKLYGKMGSVDYGTIASITPASGMDNSYELMEMGLAYKPGDFSYIFNTSGEVIGISKNRDKDTLVAIGISDLKSMIENLSVGKGAAYVGITGQNVTSAMATMYGLPMGIYVSEVEMDSPAYQAGIQSGDVITAIDENMVLTIQSFSEKLYQCDNGQSIRIKAKRLGKEGYNEVEFTASVQFRN